MSTAKARRLQSKFDALQSIAQAVYNTLDPHEAKTLSEVVTEMGRAGHRMEVRRVAGCLRTLRESGLAVVVDGAGAERYRAVSKDDHEEIPMPERQPAAPRAVPALEAPADPVDELEQQVLELTTLMERMSDLQERMGETIGKVRRRAAKGQRLLDALRDLGGDDA